MADSSKTKVLTCSCDECRKNAPGKVGDGSIEVHAKGFCPPFLLHGALATLAGSRGGHLAGLVFLANLSIRWREIR
jgi:hypothetical protein